jgi:hypothetical protein
MVRRLAQLKHRRVKAAWSEFRSDEAIADLIASIDPMQARLEKHTFEIEALSRVIRSPRTPTERRDEAVQERDSMISAKRVLSEEIESLQARLRYAVERDAVVVGATQPAFSD